MKTEIHKRLKLGLPWLITLLLLGVISFYSYFGHLANPFEINLEKVNLLSQMRIQLLKSIEAEKNAVMAITDEDSIAFAAQTREAEENVEKDRKQMEALLHKENDSNETQLLGEFNTCWSNYRKLDEDILNLAVQNTNLKAQELSAMQGTEAMNRFEQSLEQIIAQKSKEGQAGENVLLAYEAMTNGLKILALHKLHIEEASDRVMDKIELEIKTYDQSARKALAALLHNADRKTEADLKHAEAAYSKFMTLTEEIIRLSRKNTNIKSVELSLGKKRVIAAQCQESLAALQKTVKAQKPEPSR